MTTASKSWQQMLDDAAETTDVDADTFMRLAWTAYLAARPGMKERLEEAQLRAQLEAMRQAGHMPQA